MIFPLTSEKFHLSHRFLQHDRIKKKNSIYSKWAEELQNLSSTDGARCAAFVQNTSDQWDNKKRGRVLTKSKRQTGTVCVGGGRECGHLSVWVNGGRGRDQASGVRVSVSMLCGGGSCRERGQRAAWGQMAISVSLYDLSSGYTRPASQGSAPLGQVHTGLQWSVSVRLKTWRMNPELEINLLSFYMPVYIV